jgi:hypothetical protein
MAKTSSDLSNLSNIQGAQIWKAWNSAGGQLDVHRYQLNVNKKNAIFSDRTCSIHWQAIATWALQLR